MLQQSPVLPNYETPIQEPNLDPSSQAPFGERINTIYYQFLNLLLQVVQPLSEQPVTGTAKAGTITLNGGKGIITTEALATAAGATYTLELANPQIEETSLLMLTVSNGANTAGLPVIAKLVVADQTATITIKNAGATAFNGTLVVQFLIQ